MMTIELVMCVFMLLFVGGTALLMYVIKEVINQIYKNMENRDGK